MINYQRQKAALEAMQQQATILSLIKAQGQTGELKKHLAAVRGQVKTLQVECSVVAACLEKTGKPLDELTVADCLTLLMPKPKHR